MVVKINEINGEHLETCREVGKRFRFIGDQIYYDQCIQNQQRRQNSNSLITRVWGIILYSVTDLYDVRSYMYG